ncbi:MAG: protein kinase [Sandaracinaceae bacterium]|nr:protein kinase [Sandaracinaceae bacterium]MBK8406887.1 protein kinase [Sandaracinaceae bacterium]
MRVCQHCGTAADESDRFCAVCGARLPEEGSSGSSDPLIGRTVGGSYTLQEIVGVGGMGRVYRAEQGTLGRTVAIKVIHPHLLGDDQTVARFYQEARAASRLNHPNSVSIIDFGRTEDGILYLAMEHLTGRDLSLVMHEEGPLPFKRVCNILIAVLDALGEAHQLGIVHRDLKPENIILTRTRSGSDLVKVVDFGLATIVGGETSITRPGLVCGTPDYMSPEQGRGDPVDGRGDLYSLGVMLFELLCDQLPFVDDTPTKVVLRHLNDPVPDPRTVVPHRGIPDSLAEIVLRALEKDPDDRFADAVAMQEALRAAMEGLKSSKGSTRCAGCGELNPAGMRFCGACGARLPSQLGPPPATPARTSRRSVYPVLLDQRPLVGRAAELARLVETCDRATGRTLWLRIDGEPGVGKSRLVQEAARVLSERGDVVIATGGPHPSGAPVPYHAVTALLATLLGVPRERFRELATEGNGFDALAQAGIDDVLEPKGLEGADNAGRSGAAAAAVAAALVLSMSRNDARRAMIVLDDLQRCDGLTQLCASALPTALEGVSSLLVTIGRERFGDPEPMVLRGLSVEETGLFLAGKTSPTAPTLVSMARTSEGVLAKRMLPLYLEQILALGGNKNEETLPPRLADAVGLRFDRVGASARRMLQAAAVLGTESLVSELQGITEPAHHEGVGELVHAGLLVQDGELVRFPHVFLRDLAEAFIPAEARRELHRAALRMRQTAGSPTEVLAEHAYRTGEAMMALMVLERMGDASLSRGDGVGAVLGYRRALEVARREVLETGDMMMDAALVTFSRKLGRALEHVGDLSGADGVLREALDLVAPSSPEHVRMLVDLARVSLRRERSRDAMRHCGLALERVAGVNPEVESEVQLTIGRIRRTDGNATHAVIAFRRAVELYRESKAAPAMLLRAKIELGEALAENEQVAEAILALTEAEQLSREAGLSALAARALGVLGMLESKRGDAHTAASRFRAAGRLAAEAGDAEGVYRYAGFAASL